MPSSSHLGAIPSRIIAQLPPLAALAGYVLRTSAHFPAPVSQFDPAVRLLHAAQNGNLAEVDMLLRVRVPVDTADFHGYTALGLAARGGHTDIVRILLQAHANPNIAASGGVTPLMLAAQGGFSDVMTLLGAWGANIETVNHAGYSALTFAVHSAHPAAVNVLLGMGANPNAVPPGSGSLLELAARLGQPATVDLLVQSGARLYPDGHGMAPALVEAVAHHHRDVAAVLVRAGVDLDAHLRYAAVNGMPYTVVGLLRVGANVDAPAEGSGYTALMAAAARGHTEIVNILVRAGANIQADFLRAAASGNVVVVNALVGAGANVNAKSDSGFTAAMLAATNGHTAVVAALKHAGANVVHDFLVAAEYGMARIVTVLARGGVDVNVTDGDGVTALMRAAREGHIEVVNALVQAGANADASLPMAEQGGNAGTAHVPMEMLVGTDIVVLDGFTALMLAALHGHAEVVAALRQVGADIDTDLFLAADRGMVQLMAALARAGGNVNVADDAGITALMGAAIHGDIDMVNALVQAGADIHGRLPMAQQNGNAGAELTSQTQGGAAVAINGFTASMLAALHGQTAVVAALRQAGANIDTDLLLAAELGIVQIVPALVRGGGNVNATDDVGYTVLMVAASYGHIDMVNALVQAGADLHGRVPMAPQDGNAGTAQVRIEVGTHHMAVNGFSALMLAMLHGHTAVVAALTNAGADIPGHLRMAASLGAQMRAEANAEAIDAADRMALAAQDDPAALAMALSAGDGNGHAAMYDHTDAVAASLPGAAMADAAGSDALMYPEMGNVSLMHPPGEAAEDVLSPFPDGQSPFSQPWSMETVDSMAGSNAIDEVDLVNSEAFAPSVSPWPASPIQESLATTAAVSSEAIGQMNFTTDMDSEFIPAAFAFDIYGSNANEPGACHDLTFLSQVELVGFSPPA